MALLKGKRGQTLTSFERYQILKVLEDFQETMNKTKAVEACSKATGRSPRMIYKLAKQKEQGTLEPPKRTKRPHIKSHMRIVKYKSDVRSSIRRIVHTCFVTNIPPVLNTILDTINAINQFQQFKRGTLYNLLKDMGFEYARRGSKGIFVEKKDIINSRHNYLKKIKKARRQNKTVIYTGTLRIDMAKIWKDLENNEDNSTFIIVHAGFEYGFIEGAQLTFLCKTQKTDRDKELDSETYKEWFLKKLLPNCPKNSVIVDDVKCCSQNIGNVPTLSSSKDEIIEWLERREIEVDPTLLVFELLELVNSIKNEYEDEFNIDEECKRHGLEVLRLPQHHRELNPMDMMWDLICSFIKENSTACKDNILQLINESYETITAEDWSNFLSEVEANENFLWQADCLQDNIDNLIEKLKSA